MTTPFWWPETRTLWMCISCFFIIVMFWWKPPDGSNQLLTTIIGIYFGTGLVTAIGWWMGSSKSSSDKDDTIKGMAAGNGRPADTATIAKP